MHRKGRATVFIRAWGRPSFVAASRLALCATARCAAATLTRPARWALGPVRWPARYAGQSVRRSRCYHPGAWR